MLRRARETLYPASTSNMHKGEYRLLMEEAEMEDTQEQQLLQQLNDVYMLLSRVQPISREGDVQWVGPWFVPKPDNFWFPTTFFLFRGTLYCRMQIGGSTRFELHWTLGGSDLELPPEESSFPPLINGIDLWTNILEQVQQKLQRGIADPSQYNQEVAENLPLESRTGQVKRYHCWPEGVETLLPPDELDAFTRAAARGRVHEPYRTEIAGKPLCHANSVPARTTLSRRQYLADVAIAYDAAFPDTRDLTPDEKYRRHADSRHGGLLFLTEDDEAGFREWFDGKSRRGAHPFEIVHGIPHGIHLYIHHNDNDGSWSYLLSVSEIDLYEKAAHMMIALDAANIPVGFPASLGVLLVLTGEDDIQIGAGYWATTLRDLRQVNPQAIDYVRWDALPQLALITEDQTVRIKQAEHPKDGRR